MEVPWLIALRAEVPGNAWKCPFQGTSLPHIAVQQKLCGRCWPHHSCLEQDRITPLVVGKLLLVTVRTKEWSHVLPGARRA